MAFILNAGNITTRMYAEVIEEISRADATIVQAAIDAAIDEAKGYMVRYDIPKILGSASVNATVTDGNLLSKLKDLFVWHFIALGNANIEYGPAESRYLMAIEKYFEKVQLGKVNPDGWPYKDTTQEATPPEGLEVTANSNPKRQNQF